MRGERGFTLLEVLVALAIAALALSVLFRTGSDGALSVQTAAGYEEAVSRAKSHLAALNRDTGLLEGESEGDDGGGYHWHLRVTPVAASKPPKGAHPVAGERALPLVTLYTVELGISWRAGGKEREFVLRTSRLAPQVRS